MPKETVPRPQTLSPNGPEAAPDPSNQVQKFDPPIEKPKIKLERTKSILKQSSKERNENQELHSPKREQITFAADVNDAPEKTVTKKRVSLETDDVSSKFEIVRKEDIPIELKSPSPEKIKSNKKSEESESSRSESEQKNIEKIGTKSANNHLSFQADSLSRSNSQKAVLKSLEIIKKNVGGHSAGSESSSSTQDKLDSNLKNTRNSVERKNNLDAHQEEQRVHCSPSVDLTTNPAVTYVSASSDTK